MRTQTNGRLAMGARFCVRLFELQSLGFGKFQQRLGWYRDDIG